MPGENSINRAELVERLGTMAARLNAAQIEALAVALETREPCVPLIEDLTRSQRAMIGARLASRGKKANRFSPPPTGIDTDHPTACRLLDVGRSMLIAARRLLRTASAQEIADIERGRTGTTWLASKTSRRDRTKNDSFVWQTFRRALTDLTALPSPAECVTVVRHTDRHAFTPKHLDRAHAWLTAFIEAYHANKDKAA